MRPVDYLIDARDILLRRQPYKESELEGLISRVPSTWRCMVGLHYPEYGNTSWSYFDPPEYGYFCGECLDDVLPLRYRISEWFYSTRLGERVVNFDAWLYERRAIRKGELCAKHGVWLDYPKPCNSCSIEAAR